MFIIDSSGSVRDTNPPDGSHDNWRLLLQFVSDIVYRLPIGTDATRVGLIRFSTTASSLIYLNSYMDKARLQEEIMKVAYVSGKTNTAGALQKLYQEQFLKSKGDRVDVQNIAVVITDGDPSITQTPLRDTGEIVQQNNIITYAIGISNKVSELTLQRIVSNAGSNRYWRTDNFITLHTLLDTLVTSGCQSGPVRDVQPGELSVNSARKHRHSRRWFNERY